MEAELRRFKRYSGNVKWFLVASGLWPNFRPIFLKHILFFSTFFSSFVVMVTVSNFCFQNITNIMILTRGMGLAISFVSVFMKVCIFLLHQDDLVNLEEDLTAKYMQDLKNSEDRPDLLYRVRAFTYFMYTHCILSAITMFIYSIMPLIVLAKYGKYINVFPSVLPFAYESGGLVYWSLYVVEVTGAMSLWTITIGVDCCFGMYSLQVCGELRVLSKRFDELRVADDYEEKLRDCIERHYLLINAKNRLENIYGLISIWLAVSGALVLCSLIFQVTEASKSNQGYLHASFMCCYLIPKSVQIFTYAWYGNLIAEESGACLDSMYNSHWPDTCDVRFKNDILIVLAQDPLILIAKGCMYIQLDMFTKIVKASVSYLCLLRTLNDANE